MDQKKIGSFLKELRKEKGLTQEQLAELMYVSDRTVSRWETGSNLPSLDILIRISNYYNVELSEILDGERKSGKMNKELEETVLKVADYSNDEKMKMMKKLHIFSWIGVVSFLIYLALDVTGLAGQGITEAIASFCSGLALGMLITAVLYTSNSIYKIKAFKKRLLGKNKIAFSADKRFWLSADNRYGPKNIYVFRPVPVSPVRFQRFPI